MESLKTLRVWEDAAKITATAKEKRPSDYARMVNASELDEEIRLHFAQGIIKGSLLAYITTDEGMVMMDCMDDIDTFNAMDDDTRITCFGILASLSKKVGMH